MIALSPDNRPIMREEHTRHATAPKTARDGLGEAVEARRGPVILGLASRDAFRWRAAVSAGVGTPKSDAGSAGRYP
jgi:hypothetical protein